MSPLASARSRVVSWSPSFREFERLFDGTSAIPVWATVDPPPDPLAVFGGADDSWACPFVLESRGPVSETARYVIASSHPCRLLVPESGGRAAAAGGVSGIAALREELLDALPVRGAPPFVGGAVGFLSYDLGRRFERLPSLARDDLRVPDFCLGIYDDALVIDRRSGVASVVATIPPSDGPRPTYERAREMIRLRLEAFSSRDGAARGIARGTAAAPVLERTGRAAYERKVRSVKELIRAGDVFQVNLSRRVSAAFSGDLAALHRRLRRASPAGFAACLEFPGIAIVSSSPERFVRVSGREIETRPIKGTIRRGAGSAEDDLLERRLRGDPKERAEHIMTVDLLRNDLGRVCEFGSVRVAELMRAERCPRVIHLVSTVGGRLRAEVDPVDLLTATFPGGSVTGAPKIRAMEIIDELEEVRRGVYTGSIGYFSHTGAIDLSVAIRTIILKDGIAHLNVGGGVVFDSDPTREFEETELKAEGMLAALGLDGAGEHSGRRLAAA